MYWLLVFIISSIVFSPLVHWLQTRGLWGRFIGDFSIKAFGRTWYFPLGSALFFSFILSLVFFLLT